MNAFSERVVASYRDNSFSCADIVERDSSFEKSRVPKDREYTV